MLQGCAIAGMKSGGWAALACGTGSLGPHLPHSALDLLSLGCCLDVVLNNLRYYTWAYGAPSVVEKARSHAENLQYERTLSKLVSFCLTLNKIYYSLIILHLLHIFQVPSLSLSRPKATPLATPS